jgi:hypothetical protein
MDFRDSKFRLILIVVALGIVLVVVVASCGGGSDDEAKSGGNTSSSNDGDDQGDPDDDKEGDEEAGKDHGEEQILAQVTGDDSITLTVTRAEREDGGFLTVEGTLHNGGDSQWRDSNWAGYEVELTDNGFSMAGAAITAKAEGRKYLILRDTSGRCLCTLFDLHISVDQTVNWFAQFPAPEPSTKEVDFQIGQLPPATFEIR